MSMNQTAFRIGVSGHQHLGDETTLTFISQQLRDVLTMYREQARQRDQEVVAYAALAVGTDQMFIKIALELDIPVEAVIPCLQYEEIFMTREARSEYHHLLSRCRSIHRLSTPTCSDEAYLEAGHWIVDHSDVVIVVWNGYPALGKGGTGDVASYARSQHRPFIHLHTRLHTTKQYGKVFETPTGGENVAAKREFTVAKKTLYQGPVLTLTKYHMRMPNGREIERDIVERPESVLVLPLGRQHTVLLIEEYDLGAETWQLTLPGGKVTDPTPDGLRRQAERELREELGYRAGKLEKLVDIYGHPGYVAHKVHLFVAQDLEWDPLELENEEEMRVLTMSLDEALAATQLDYRCDPEAALTLWLYAGRNHVLKSDQWESSRHKNVQ